MMLSAHELSGKPGAFSSGDRNSRSEHLGWFHPAESLSRATVSTCIVSSADDGGRSPYLTGPTGWSAQDPRAAFFAFLAARFSFRLADDAFLIFFPPFSFDAIRGLLTDCGQSGRAAPIVYRGRLQRQQRH